MTDRQNLSSLEAYYDSKKEESLEVIEKISNKGQSRRPQGPDLTFLSHDDKVRLAVRSSLLAGPGAYCSNDTHLSSTSNKPTQAEMLKSAMRTLPVEVWNDDGRRNPPVDDGPQVPRNESDRLQTFHDQMNSFQERYDSEIKMEDERINILKEKRKRIWFLVTTLLVILTITIVTSLSIAFALNPPSHQALDSKQEDEHNFDLEDIDQCYSHPLMNQERFEQFRSLLKTLHPSISNSIDVPYSNASVALCWLVYHDRRHLQPLNDVDVVEIMERFLLAWIYFSFVEREHLTDDKYNIFSDQNWLSPSHVCEWTLVDCTKSSNGKNGHIHGLTFSKLDLAGRRIPSEIALLTNLTKLNFFPQELMGSIPSQLWDLTKLENFSLSIKNEGGTNFQGLEKLTHLQRLILQANFEGHLPEFSSLRQLTQLEIRDPSSVITSEFPDFRDLTNLSKLCRMANVLVCFLN